MYFYNVYVNLVRAALVILSFYHIYKRQYKYIISTALTVALTFLPSLLNTLFDIKLDIIGSYLYIVTIVMTMYLGNSLKFYDKFFWWDMVIHFLSGIVFVSIAVALSKKVVNLEKLPTLFFGFTYSLSHHVIWEVLEYISDCIFHTDHQRWQKVSATVNHVSKSAIQPAGLVDTMNDTIICIVGTIVACIAWWFVL